MNCMHSITILVQSQNFELWPLVGGLPCAFWLGAMSSWRIPPHHCRLTRDSLHNHDNQSNHSNKCSTEDFYVVIFTHSSACRS
jgi:hypothetical protein